MRKSKPLLTIPMGYLQPPATASGSAMIRKIRSLNTNLSLETKYFINMR